MEICLDSYLLPLHNERSRMLVGWKLRSQKFNGDNVNSYEPGLFNIYYTKLNNYTLWTHDHPIVDIYVNIAWILVNTGIAWILVNTGIAWILVNTGIPWILVNTGIAWILVNTGIAWILVNTGIAWILVNTGIAWVLVNTGNCLGISKYWELHFQEIWKDSQLPPGPDVGNFFNNYLRKKYES